VLRELCQEIEWREDLKIPIRARSEVVGMRVGKGLTSLLLGFGDNLSSTPSVQPGMTRLSGKVAAFCVYKYQFISYQGQQGFRSLSVNSPRFRTS